jgi:hypothetical protein
MTSTKDLLQPIVRLTPDDAHYFFGYYDIPAWSRDDSAHLVHRVEFRDRMPTAGDVAQLGLVHPGRDGFTQIAETTAWNFQQGAMLQWHPLSPDSKIIFNRRDGGRFVGVIKDIVTGEEQILPRAVSNVDPRGRYSLHVNFSRQFDFRPGYGYAGIPDPFAAVKQPEEDGIIRMDLESGKETLVMSLAEIIRLFPGPMRDRKIIINHINLNTDGSRFIALVRNFPDSVETKSFFTGALTADADGRNAYMLVDYSIASHYHWRDPENLVMVVKRQGEEINLREFRDRSQQSHQLVHEFFKDDGHCSYSPDRQWLLYDSYPQEGYRYLYIYHLASGQGWCLGGVKTLPRMEGVEMEIRCDLHPRWNRMGDAISFDSLHEGFRGIYSMQIGPLLRQLAATTTQGASVEK